MSAGTERLHEQLSAIGEALEAFDDPVTDELAGLRLMRSTLRDRQAHLQSTITKQETCSLELVIQGAPADGALALPFALEVLDALQDAVNRRRRRAPRRRCRRCACPAGHRSGHPASGELSTTDGVTVTLQRSPCPLTAQLIEPASGAPLVERALDTLLAVLDAEGDEGDGVQPPAGTVPALQRLAAAVAAEPVELRLASAPAILEPRELTLTRSDAQRLAAALTSR